MLGHVLPFLSLTWPRGNRFEVDSAVSETMPSTSGNPTHHVAPHAPPTPAQAAHAPSHCPSPSPSTLAQTAVPHIAPGSHVAGDLGSELSPAAAERVESVGPRTVEREDTGVLLRAKQWRAGNLLEAGGDDLVSGFPVDARSAKRMRTQV
jgi:hypothetical protein